MSPLRTVVVDDEPLARRAVIRALGDVPDVEVVGEAGDGEAAVALIAELGPDLVFLDVQMPGLDGFDVLGLLPVDARPHVVFVTAFSEHAVAAFDASAVDYVLKPFEPARIRDAVRKASERQARLPPGELLSRLAPSVGARPLRRFAVRDRGRIHFVEARDVEWIAADGNYLILHASRRRHLVRMTLADVEARAGADGFARVHRSTIVNVRAVMEVVPRRSGDCTIRLASGAEVTLSRSYKDRFLARMVEGRP